MDDGSWLVYTAEDLKAWTQSEDVLTTSCTLHACIDLSELEEAYWTPIGDYTD